MNASNTKRLIGSLSARFWKVLSLAKSSQLRNIKVPPRSGEFILSNSYVPITKRTLIRELLQDSLIIPASERKSFEKVAAILERKIATLYNGLQTELLLSSQFVHPGLNLQSTDVHDIRFDVTDHHASTNLGKLSALERRDEEFLLLRRMSQLASLAGFIEVTDDQLQAVCQPTTSANGPAAVYSPRNMLPQSFINPADYEVLRFWIRGLHPSTLVEPRPDVSKTRYVLHNISQSFKWLNSTSRNLISKFRKREGGSQHEQEAYPPPVKPFRGSAWRNPDDSTFGRVLMAVKPSDQARRNLMVKLFQNVPVSRPRLFSRSNSSFGLVDNLRFLLPELHLTSLGPTNRLILLSAGSVAVIGLGILRPLSSVLANSIVAASSLPAWSLTVSLCSALVGLGVWANHMRGQVQLANWIVNLHYECSYNFGAQTLLTLSRLAQEEEFKKAVLVYALLLSSTEKSQLPIKPSQLGIRAESWLGRRIPTQHHIALRPSLGPPTYFTHNKFSGGSGPSFDLSFDVQRPLQLLAKLDLVHGDLADAPKATPLNVAHHLGVSIIDEADDEAARSTATRGNLWLLDPNLPDECDLGRSST